MKAFSDYEAKHGIPELRSQRPVVKWEFYAYSGGKSFGPFNTRAEAKVFSSNCEQVKANDNELEEFSDRMQEATTKAFQEWYGDLREEYPQLTDEQFNICYGMADSCVNGGGHDELANHLIGVTEFAMEIIKSVGR